MEALDCGCVFTQVEDHGLHGVVLLDEESRVFAEGVDDGQHPLLVVQRPLCRKHNEDESGDFKPSVYLLIE